MIPTKIIPTGKIPMDLVFQGLSLWTPLTAPRRAGALQIGRGKSGDSNGDDDQNNNRNTMNTN